MEFKYKEKMKHVVFIDDRGSELRLQIDGPFQPTIYIRLNDVESPIPFVFQSIEDVDELIKELQRLVNNVAKQAG